MTGKSRTITAYIFETTSVSPDRPALIDADTEEEWTFAEFKDVIRRAGSALTKYGFQHGDVLAVCAPNSADYLVLMLAATAIGGTGTGMSAMFKENEIIQRCQDCAAKYLVVNADNLDKVPEVLRKCEDVQQVFVIGEVEGYPSVRHLMADDGEAFPDDVNIDPEQDVAFLAYSSGTTGLPKGIMQTHFGLINTMESFLKTLIHKPDRPVYVTLFHLSVMSSILLSLALEATIVVSAGWDFEKFLSNIEKYKGTAVIIPPTILTRLAKDEVVDNYDLSHLNFIFSISSHVTDTLIREVEKRLNAFGCIRRVYGLTETCGPTHVTDTHNTVGNNSTGKPLSGVHTKIVDIHSGCPLGPGESGELCLKTPTLMKGYLNNPKATAATIDSEGWLHTGDLCYEEKDGSLVFVERLKELIKHNGIKVYPAELENVIHTHDSVSEVGVVGVPDEVSGENTRAYIVLKQGVNNIKPEDIQQYVASRVADYKHLHGGVRFVNAVPRTGTGKINRSRLKEMVRLEQEGHGVLPSGAKCTKPKH